jgi:hypothetical protein
MRSFRAVAVFVVMGAALALPLAHCGSGDSGGGGPGDAAARDSTAADRTTTDAYTQDSASGTDATDAAADDVSGDDAQETDGQSGDDADAAVDTGIDATPCDIDAGDAGDDGPTCSATQTCCGGFCTDTSKDPRNCGTCGNACSTSQFCTGQACDDAVLKNICVNASATVALDQFQADNTAGMALGNALSTACMPAVKVASTAQDAGTVEDPSGRPITGVGDTLLAGGGYFGQASAAYMDGHGLTPLIVTNTGANASIHVRKTMASILSVPSTMLTMHHDYVVLELAVEPVSGTLCLYGYGLTGWGTLAAGYYFQNNIVPNAAMFTDAWYVYEWTDTDMNSMPSAADTFALVAHGM